MPYPNEHALRLENPNKYSEYRRTKGGTIYGSLKVPKTISIIWGHVKGEPKDAFHPQALRFPIKDWTESKAKNWIEKNIKSYISFDPASTEKFNGVNLPVFKISPLLSDELQIAIVDDPAIQEYFIAFNKEVVFEKFSYDVDRQIIKGAVMIPDTMITRNQPFPSYVVYDKESIEQAATYFFKNGCKFNDDHTDKLIDIEVLESFFISEENKFNNYPDGTWVISAKVPDKELFLEFKNKKLGFSFQGNFEKKLITENFNNKNNNKDKMNEFKEKMLNVLNTYLFNEEVVEETIKEVEEVIEEVQEEVSENVVVEEVQEFAEQATSGDTQTQTEMETTGTTQEYVTPEQLSQALEVIVEQIAQLSARIDEMGMQVQEFGNQVITVPVTEEVQNTSKLTTKSPYAKF